MITCLEMYVCLIINAYMYVVYIRQGLQLIRNDCLFLVETTILSGSIFDRSVFIDDYIYASLRELPSVHGKKCKLHSSDTPVFLYILLRRALTDWSVILRDFLISLFDSPSLISLTISISFSVR